MNARQRVLQTISGWKGQRDAVIDVYNSFLPHPRGYKVKYSDLACAATVSAAFIALGDKYTAIVPPECGAWRLYRNMDALGCAVWGNDYTPKAGDLIFFGVGNNDTKIDHVGIFECMDGNKYCFWDIRSTVAYHSYTPGTKSSISSYGYILGWGTPDYASIDVDEPGPAPYEFTVGDLVMVNPGAKWYKGQSIKLSVINDQWYIMSIRGDRAVLGMNLAETRCIQSPIHTCDITLVSPIDPPVDESVTLTVTVKKDTAQLLQIMADGNHKTVGQIIDMLVDDVR